MKKKVLITGITGMVGSHLADYLLKETNHKIYGACRWRSPTDNVMHLSKHVNDGKRLFFEYMDLSDSYSINILIKKIRFSLILNNLSNQLKTIKLNSCAYPIQIVQLAL